MKRFSLRWMAWYGDSEVTFDVPDDWDLTISHIADGEDIGNEGIQMAFETPIGSAPLRELARGKRRAAIAVDDISRPTQASRLLPRIITELEEGGVERKNMKVVMATGAHRPMHRFDLIKKLGEKVYYTMDIHHHHPFENIVDLGFSSRGTPIHINRLFMEADIKIGVGCIVPHSYAGFGGGGKIVLPGLAGIDTLEKNHLPAVTGLKAGLNLIEGNENRADIEEVARTVGLDLIVNVVVNSRRGIAGCFVGDPVEAHRAGVERARTIYRTTVPEEEFDLVILNAQTVLTSFCRLRRTSSKERRPL
jgi:nickel-dependent lactate racemase